MAASAAETMASSRGNWWQTLAPAPGRLEFAGRLALICALTVLVTQIYQTPEPALTAYLVFFLNRENRATSVLINAGLCLVVTVIIAGLMLLARNVAEDPLWRVSCIAVLSFGLLWLTSASRLRSVGGTLALVVGFALDVLGMIQVGEEATRGLLYAWLLVGIPAGVSLIVNLLMAPAPRRLTEQALARRLRVCATLLRGPDEPARAQLKQYLDEGTHPLLQHLRLAALEGTNPARDLAALRQAVTSCWALMSAVDVVDCTAAAALPHAWRNRVAQVLEEMADLLDEGKYPLEVYVDRAAAVGPLAAQLAAEVRDAVMDFAQVPAAPTPVKAERSRFFAKDAFTDPVHVRFALRTTAAALFCYALYTVLDWPGIHTCFLTCYIVSLGTTAESVEKLLLRLLGCLIGSAAGLAAILFLMPSLSSISGLMLVVFLGAAGSAYVAAGSPRISYAGFQVAFAFFLCILQGSGPAFDMSVARDRVIGILIGNLVAYVFLTRLWPVTIGARVDPAIAGNLRRLAQLTSTQDPQARRQLTAEVRAGLSAVETDIALAGYEPRMLRPSLAWLSSRREAISEAAAVTSVLLVGCQQGVGLSESVSGRLRHAADALEAGTADPPAVSRVLQPSSLQTLVDAHLHGLEQALAEAPDARENQREAM